MTDGVEIQQTLTGDELLSTNETVQSAHVGTNAELFPKVLDLHVERGARIADVTYGTGTFWKHVPNDLFDLVASDINSNKSPIGEAIDCRDLPYSDDSFDCVVLDPPYSSGFFKEANQKATDGEYSQYRSAYTSDSVAIPEEKDIHPQAQDTRKRHARVLDIYYGAGEEAKRVLHDDGVCIVKTQDEVSDNYHYFTHSEVIEFYEKIGFNCRDLFVLVQNNRTTTPNDTQHVALKNHSYFLVFDRGGSSLRDRSVGGGSD